jgi:predicted nucleic acid-binding protein
VQLTYGLLDAAANLSVPLRSLDAIHLASALRLGTDLRAFVAYDERLLFAAEQVGLAVVAPGAS